MWGFQRRWALLVALIALLGASRSEAQTTTELSCQNTNLGSGIVQQCTGSGTISAGEQDTYTWTLPSDYVVTAYESFDVDLDVRLSSVTGDVNLQASLPSGATFASNRNVGEDVIFINKKELETGEYVFYVNGVAQTSNYILTVYITEERELNPFEEIVVGQILIDCCNQDPTSCTVLKKKYPTLVDNDNSTNPNFCYIHGNVCTRDGRLEELSMPGNNMVCKLPAQALKTLSKLERIDLSNNSIAGNISEIADTLAGAASLEFLDLSRNRVWGNLSAACGLAKSGYVEQLSLAANNLTGGIPACLLALKNLVELRLDGNALQGSIPAFANAKSCKLVRFTAANQTAKGGGLNGSLPVSIRDLSRLAYLDVSGNAISGDLPTLPPSVKSVKLANNALSNSGYAEAIPASYGTLSLLTTLAVQNNSLSGFLPAGIASIKKLQLLDASRNMLSSTLPQEWLRDSDLAVLKLDHNSLTGTIPSGIGHLPNLRLLDLNTNQLSGTLDGLAVAVAESDSVLRYLNLADNELSGLLAELGGLMDLGMFSMSAEDDSTPPANLTLDLSGNDFSGAFPSWLLSAMRLAEAKVAVNLTGSVLTCPSTAWIVEKPVPKGWLDGLTCQSTSSAGNIQQVPLDQMVKHKHEDDDDELSGGAIFGIILAVLVATGALGYIAWYWYRHTQRQKAAAAAAFSSGFGSAGSGYPLQSRPQSGQGYGAFSDDRSWAEPHSGDTSPTRAAAAPAAKPKHVGLASLPLSQKGEF